MIEVDATVPVVGTRPVPLRQFEGRRQLIVSYHMWHDGQPAAEQCEGYTFFTGQVRNYPTFTRATSPRGVLRGPFDESTRYRAFMGWDMPWYAPARSRMAVAARRFGMKGCYLRDGDRVFETYWGTGRGPRH